MILSRADPLFVKALFAIEVPEIYQGIVEIKEISREVGGRTKIAVSSRDESIDPVGACVGLKGSRVQAVVNMVLRNERTSAKVQKFLEETNFARNRKTRT